MPVNATECVASRWEKSYDEYVKINVYYYFGLRATFFFNFKRHIFLFKFYLLLFIYLQICEINYLLE